MLRRIGSNAFKQLTAQILVRHFTATETQRDFHFVAVFQKLENIAHFDIIVVVIRVWTELNFFDLNNLLFFTGLSFFFLSLVFELTVVHNFANRWAGIWRNFNKVKPCDLSQFHGAFWCYNAFVLAFRPDEANVGPANAFVNAGSGVALWWRVMGSASYGLYPFVVFDVKS